MFNKLNRLIKRLKYTFPNEAKLSLDFIMIIGKYLNTNQDFINLIY